MHSANKKLSMIRSKSMERFSKKQELIVVTPRIKTVEPEESEEFSGPFIGQVIVVTILSFEYIHSSGVCQVE